MGLNPRRRTTDLRQKCEGPIPTEPILIDGVQASIPQNAFFDVIVIGAGPAALSLVTRILESRPAAIYLEEEREFLHWLQRRKNNTVAAPGYKTACTGRGAEKALTHMDHSKRPVREAPFTILILDKLGDGWMGQWNQNFTNLEIPYLRSPMFFHPDPSDLDGLLEYAVKENRASIAPYTHLYEPDANGRTRKKTRDVSVNTHVTSREPELLEIPGVVGKEASKHKKKQSRLRKFSQLQTSLGPAVNERDRRDFHSPGTRLFWDFIQQTVKEYGLEPSRAEDGSVVTLKTRLEEQEREANTTSRKVELLQAEVSEVDYGSLSVITADGEEEKYGFLARTCDGCQVGAKAAVPKWLLHPPTASAKMCDENCTDSHLDSDEEAEFGACSDSDLASSSDDSEAPEPYMEDMMCDLSLADGDDRTSMKESQMENKDATVGTEDPYVRIPTHGTGWAHSSAICTRGFEFPSAAIKRSMQHGKQITVVVVGGGLTSAQICALAVRRGISKVILLMRGFMKMKAFDFGLEWVGKYSNLSKMQFWQTDDPKMRMDIIHSARNGGSIPLPYIKLLLRLAREGKVEIRTHTEVSQAIWREQDAMWDLILHRKDNVTPDTRFMNNKQQPGTFADVQADYIVSCTGTKLGFNTLPFMRKIAEKAKVYEENGLPVLDEDLQYGELPFFCVGPYSSLQIGAAGFNLGGMRESAERVSIKLHEILASHSDDNESDTAQTTDAPNKALGNFPHFAYHYLEVE
ncbi:hypothetical protein MVES1_000051 [Malassezia vespertilionis]|uniref:uncharacterized protein n=1 Tax=Malassezia vespertilionis TaxID=2020962 RepID=UPI0024B11226|nr:uncharacterized protein MVES1_000051 [Malassezia vespertilionis]WFD04727.1 hypothetical protein MVES1_000051 [Malassezia vespertilionis]